MSEPIVRLYDVNWVAQMEAKRLVLSLREMLVRFDENLAAHTLMQSCVPHILESDPEVDRARAEQAAKVDHIVGDSYAQYYATNHHERPFEEQYQCSAEKAHEQLFRAGYLRSWVQEQWKTQAVRPLLQEQWKTQAVRPIVLDLASNDGWLAKNLQGLATYHGLDLNPHCIERAIGRNVPDSRFEVAFAENAEAETYAIRQPDGYDAVVAYELIEHVRDPDAILAAMVACCKPGGSLFVSTPLGACTGGDLPRWWVVEPAGHVRAYTPHTFASLLARHTDVDEAAMVQPGRISLLCKGEEIGEIRITAAVEGTLMTARVPAPAIVAADGGEHVRADRAGGKGDPRPAGGPRPAER